MYRMSVLAVSIMVGMAACVAIDTWSKEFDPLLLRHENLPTCDMREPIRERCREVEGNGVVLSTGGSISHDGDRTEPRRGFEVRRDRVHLHRGLLGDGLV